MSSMSIHPVIRGTFSCPSSLNSHKPGLIKPFVRTFSIAVKPKAFSLHSSVPTTNTILDLKTRPIISKVLSSASATTEAVTAETSTESSTTATTEDSSVPTQETEKPEPEVVVMKPAVPKPRLVLKFIWMEKNIGLGLDQVIPSHGTVPLSPYFFWPRKDAWEELKTTLENKPWISQKKMIILLNQATDIINLWQQSGGNLSS